MLKALKIAVVVMGVMLVIGFAALIFVVAARVSHRGSVASAPAPFSMSAIEIPRGARIETMTTAPDRLILDLVLQDGARQIIILDLATGARLGTIELNPAP